MSADKRTVSTDALETLGTIHTRDEKRDAIHLAVIPAEACESMKPGSHVQLADGKAFQVSSGCGIGIVDPFLPCNVEAGQRFWLVIYPRVITSLRHVWTHPRLADEVGAPTSPDAKAAENRLRGWCSSSGISYEDLIEVSKSGKSGPSIDNEHYSHRWTIEEYGTGTWLLSHGSDNNTYDIPHWVWDDVRTVIGREPCARPTHFSCTC